MTEPASSTQGSATTGISTSDQNGAPSPGRQIRSILIACAMSAEANPMIESLGLKALPNLASPAPCLIWSGKQFDLQVYIVQNGKCLEHGVDNVGTVPAALSTFLACQYIQPDLLISIGTAGGFKAQGAAIGDVFLGTSTVNHDRRIPIPGFDRYGVDRRSALSTLQLQKALGFKSGLVSSGNSLDYTAQDTAFFKEQGVAVKEMEAAAVAWVAALFHLPMFSLKSVTDIVDGERPPQEEFLENLSLAAQALQQAILPVLEFISGKTTAEL